MPALMTGAGGFLTSALAAMWLTASMPTWIAGYLALWTLTGSIMAALWPAPVPTRAQVAAIRGEERVVWPAVRARLVPVFSPWFVGPGAFAGLAAAERGWGSGNLRSVILTDDGGYGFGLALCMVLAPLGVLLFTNVTFPLLYALQRPGAERAWALARATGFAGMLGMMTCALFSGEDADVSERGSADPVEAARFIGDLLRGDSATRPGWLIAVAYTSAALLATGLWCLIRSERREDAPDDEPY